MNPRDARIVTICRVISFGAMVAGAIAVVPAPDHWLWIFFIALVYGMFTSPTIPVGFFPVPLPSFDDHVAGLMLCGRSEEAAVREVSRREASRAIFMTAVTIPLLVILDLTAYNIRFVGAAAPRVLNAILGQAIWWLIGVGVFLFISPFALLAFRRRRL